VSRSPGRPETCRDTRPDSPSTQRGLYLRLGRIVHKEHWACWPYRAFWVRYYREAGYAAALAVHREIGDRQGEANVLHGIADCDRSQGRVDAARDGYAAALASHREIGDRQGEANVLNGIADCDRLQREDD